MSFMLDLPASDRGSPRGAPLAPVPPHAPALDFDEVVRRLTPRLKRYATRRLGDRHEAEELVQEALLRAFDHLDELHTEDDVAAWSTCVTGRLVIDRLRVRGRSTSMAQVPEGTRVGRDTADVVVARDEARLALDALDAMPARQAAVLWAREVEGLTYDEIGLRFAMTEPAVRSVLSRARKALRKEFATRGGTLPAGGLVVLAPWLDGLGWLDRLRRVAVRTAAPAAMGAVVLGVLGGSVLSPWTAPDAVVAPRHAVVSQPDGPQRATVARVVVEPAARQAPTAPRPVVAAAAAAAPPSRGSTTLDDTGLSDTCVRAGEAGAGGTDCSPTGTTVVHVGPPLPDNPTGIRRVGAETDAVRCSDLPDVPLTSCSTSEGEDR